MTGNPEGCTCRQGVPGKGIQLSHELVQAAELLLQRCQVGLADGAAAVL